MRFTVFTPTYNRAYIIENLYRSLQRQTFTDFEWLVIDDGSVDNTGELFARILQEQNVFPIRYLKVANGGKHRAINRAVQNASGELFFIVDSDDYLPDDALETIDRVEKTIPESQRGQFCGVCGCRGFSNDKIAGTTFEGDYLDITALERPIYKVFGDKAEVFYTNVLMKYPFPEFENEKFVTECVVWDKIAFDGYKMRFFNHIVYICDYLEDGLTAHYSQMLQKSPHGYGLYLFQCGLFGKHYGIDKWNSYLKFYYEMREHMRFSEIAECLHINPIVLYIRLLGMKVFYRLYDR